MIWRVRDRASFEALRTQGRRRHQGPVTVVYLPADAGPPRVAYAIGVKVGNAVVRNRLRRRLRSVMRDLDRQQPGLAPGTYLVSLRREATELTFDDLADKVGSACTELTGLDRAHQGSGGRT